MIKRPQKQHQTLSYPINDCMVNEPKTTGDYVNCTNPNMNSCSNNSSEIIADCDFFEQETQLQLLILFGISTSVSLLNLIAFLIVYDKDPEIDEIPNFAERQRASSGEFR